MLKSDIDAIKLAYERVTTEFLFEPVGPRRALLATLSESLGKAVGAVDRLEAIGSTDQSTSGHVDAPKVDLERG
jgi:hypothetical protein